MRKAVYIVLAFLLVGLTACFPLAGPTPIKTPITALSLSSPVFERGAIPVKYTCEGKDISLPLVWEGVPEGVKSFALIMDDPDAPGGVFTHWVLFNLPPETRSLTEGIPKEGELANGAIQGMNDFGEIGYGGPCPPKGSTHTYRFFLYALNKTLDLPPGASKAEVLGEIKGHILAEALLEGRYGR